MGMLLSSTSYKLEDIKELRKKPMQYILVSECVKNYQQKINESMFGK